MADVLLEVFGEVAPNRGYEPLTRRLVELDGPQAYSVRLVISIRWYPNFVCTGP